MSPRAQSRGFLNITIFNLKEVSTALDLTLNFND